MARSKKTENDNSMITSAVKEIDEYTCQRKYENGSKVINISSVILLVALEATG